MPFKDNVRSISPLAWLLGISCLANVLTAAMLLWFAIGGPVVVVQRYGIDVKDHPPIRVQIAP